MPFITGGFRERKLPSRDLQDLGMEREEGLQPFEWFPARIENLVAERPRKRPARTNPR